MPLSRLAKKLPCTYTHMQWRAKIFGHHLEQNNLFKISPNDLTFLEKLVELAYYMMRKKDFGNLTTESRRK